MTAASALVERLSPHIVVGLEAYELSEAESRFLQEFPPAGIILFARNIDNSSQLRELTDQIYTLFEKTGQRLPLIMADHEGGRTSVLARAIGSPPTQMAGAMATERASEPFEGANGGNGPEGGIVRELFRETAARMLACGVNMALSPVADINSEYLNPIIGTRSFGASKDLVCSLVAEAVRALKEVGILTSIKHFPGHGSTAGDSHIELPVTGKNIEQLRIKDLEPFVSGIHAGADSVMTAHIAPVDRMIPSSLDPLVVGGLLREELHYDGVVLTDGLEMTGILTGSGLVGAAAAAVSSPDRLPDGLLGPQAFSGGRDRIDLLRPACVMRTALEAGNDILLFTRPAGEVYAEIFEVLPLLESDGPFWEEIFPGISGDSLPRIDSLRGKVRKAEGRQDQSSGVYALAASRALDIKLHGRETFPPGPHHRVVFCGEKADFSYYPVISFIETLLRGPGIDGEDCSFDPGGLLPLRTASSPASKEPVELFSWAPGAGDGSDQRAMDDLVVLLCRRPISKDDVEELTGGARTVIVTDWPYAESYVPEQIPVIVTYGACDSSASAAAAVLGGKDSRSRLEFD